jgi:hypothetical protein
MYSSRELQKLLHKNLYSVLEQVGYKRKYEVIYYKPLRNNFHGFIGVFSSSCGYPYSQRVNVAFQISNADVEKLSCSLRGVKSHNGINCGPMQNLHSLIPGKGYNDLEWRIQDDNSTDRAIEEICLLLHKYVDPFFSENDNWEAYKQLVEKKTDWEKELLMPVILYLEGNKKGGEEYIIAQKKIRPDKAYRDPDRMLFVENYLKLL